MSSFIFSFHLIHDPNKVHNNDWLLCQLSLVLACNSCPSSFSQSCLFFPWNLFIEETMLFVL